MNETIWTNGCFDIIHKGHVELLSYARSLRAHTGRLVVGIDADKRVAELKGPTRPINKVEDRMAVLRAIKYVDEVVIFSSDEELEGLVKKYEPLYLVVGSDYREKTVIGGSHAKNIIFFDKIEGYSTTDIINRNEKK
jgi:rfaE bifunctional protein nucleotidyltransferase chain/domain